MALIIFVPRWRDMQDLHQKNIDYTQKIEELKKLNQELNEEKRRLEEDPVYLEKVAREKMGLAREGEVVYKIVPVEE